MRARIPGIIAIILLLTILLTIPISAENSNQKKRVIADTTSLFNKIIYRIQGCGVIHELNDATALECPPGVAIRYNLREDRIFHIVGLGANQQIMADFVWNTYNSTGEGVVVAVLDTGVNYDHPELSSDVKGGLSFIGFASTNFYSDDHGHGTHVAGIITATGINSQARGVAPDAEIWAGKVCDSSGSCWESDIAEAIEHVVNNQISRIMSISLGGGGTAGPNCNNDYLAKKVNWATDQGVVVVVAAGNSGSLVSSPGCASGAIAVGAVNHDDYVASFSGRGKALDIVAPGVNMYSTVLNGGYASWSGTSMATPMVSGTVALLLQKNSSYTVDQVKSSLYDTADSIGYNSREEGNGRLNALGAYEYQPGSNGGPVVNCPKGKQKKGLC
jgi:subtilisin family serine protease